ncbi:MAG TPA: type II secretion system F family protein [Actinomycetes bacterium]|nr:type II secretion system F family protein [Actinomycetes bacterium]
MRLPYLLVALVLVVLAMLSLRSGRRPAGTRVTSPPAGGEGGQGTRGRSAARGRGLPGPTAAGRSVAVAALTRRRAALAAGVGRARRDRALEAAVPEVLDVLRATIAAGAGPAQALAAARDAAGGGPLAAVLDAAVDAQVLGAPVGRALVEAAGGSRPAELRAAGEALDLAELTGAPPGRVLAGVALAAADRVRGRQALQAATAEARLSAQVLAALGPSFAVILAAVAPHQTAFLVRERAGWLVLAAAVALEAAGVLWAARIVGSGREPVGRARRRRPWPTRRAAAAGLAVTAGAGTAGQVLAGPRFGIVLALAGAAAALLPLVRRRRAEAAGAAARVRAAPAVVDLLAACLAAGLNGHRALLHVAGRVPAALAEDFRPVAADLHLGRAPGATLRALAERRGLEELRAAAGALEAAERWGTPPAEALAARAEALRTRLRLEAEAAAGRAAVRLTFPLILCFLPSFVLVTVVPMLAEAVRSLDL